MNYREEQDKSKPYKAAYLSGFDTLIEKKQTEAELKRKEYSKEIFTSPEKYRSDLRKALGWPLTEAKPDSALKVASEKLADEGDYEIYRMQFEILEGFPMTGLLFKTKGTDKRPLAIVQHGGLGTPELISGIYGETANYNDMLQRVRKHGIDVFAPQLLLWSDTYDVTYDRAMIDSRLKRIGSSVTAVEVYGIMRILDYFEAQSYVSVLGMVGLSYGGFFTLCTAALDSKIKAAISCSFFNSRDAKTSCMCDWSWFDSADKFNDAEIACLVYPRDLCIEIGSRDELFKCEYGRQSYEKLTDMCSSVGTDWLNFVVFDGVHEFNKNDAPIEHFAGILKKQ